MKPHAAAAILRAHGANAFRLRLFVNPNHEEVQVNDLDYTVRMAGRIKAAGAKLILEFHYSDTWADPGHQAAGDAVRILLHYSLGANVGGTQWLFDNVNAYGVPYDLIGLSYYPWWHGMPAYLRENLRAAAQRYGRDLMVVETTYPWRAGGLDETAPYATVMPWAISPQGQAQFLQDALAAVAFGGN